jgi:hypothetical protein
MIDNFILDQDNLINQVIVNHFQQMPNFLIYIFFNKIVLIYLHIIFGSFIMISSIF